MWTARAIAVLIGLVMVVPLATAQLPTAPDTKAQNSTAPDAKAPASKAPDAKAPDAKAPMRRLQTRRRGSSASKVASLADLPIGQLKPRTIAFADHPAENLVDPGTGFMRYDDWAKARPARSAIPQPLSGLCRTQH